MVRTEGQRLLREHIASLKLTHDTLAQRVHRARPTVTLWLGGSRLPDVESAALLEQVAGIPMRSWSQKPKRNGKRAA